MSSCLRLKFLMLLGSAIVMGNGLWSDRYDEEKGRMN